VRTEVDRAAGRLGFVREEELAAVRRHVSRLETQLAEVRAQIGSANAGAGSTATSAAASTAAPVKKKIPVKKKVAPAAAAAADTVTAPEADSAEGSAS
jgi:hypothetical protein